MIIKYFFLGNLDKQPKQIGCHPPDSDQRYITQSMFLLENILILINYEEL